MGFEEYFFSVLDEFETLEKLIKEAPDQPVFKRLMVRSIFAALEVFTNGFIEAAKPEIVPKLLSQLSKPHGEWPHDHANDFKILFKLCAAADMHYEIDDAGQIKIGKLRTPQKNRLLFAIRLLLESRGQEVNPKDIEGWPEFLEASKIRNRLTHPKLPSDLIVTDEEYEIVRTTWVRLMRCIYYGREEEFMQEAAR